jgi:hypothetical protein
MNNNMDFGGFIYFLLVLLGIFAPLGIWKLVEIIIWIIRNVSITVGA